MYLSSMLCRYLQSLLRFRFHVRIGIIFKPPQITDGPLRPTLTKCGIIMKMNEWNGMPHEKKMQKKDMNFFLKKMCEKKMGEKTKNICDEKMHIALHCSIWFLSVPCLYFWVVLLHGSSSSAFSANSFRLIN